MVRDQLFHEPRMLTHGCKLSGKTRRPAAKEIIDGAQQQVLPGEAKGNPEEKHNGIQVIYQPTRQRASRLVRRIRGCMGARVHTLHGAGTVAQRLQRS